MKLGLAVGAAVLLAISAFRRARNVLTPPVRRQAARQDPGARARQATTTVVSAAVVGVAVAAVVGIVWLGLELFT
jgi:hypothetical protein